MADFKGIEAVKVQAHKPREDSYFKPGKYTVEVKRFFKHEKATGAKLVVAELVILESNNPSIKAGEIKSWVQTLQFKSVGHKAMGLKSIAQFAVSAFGAEEESEGLSDSMLESLVSEDNPLAGKKLKIEVYLNQGKDGKEYTNYRFFSV